MNSVRRGLLLLLTLAACVPTPAAPPTPTAPPPPSAIIDSAALLQDVRLLSADDMEGRGTGTAGIEKARAYLAERLRQVGIRPFGASSDQPFSGRNRRGVEVSGTNLVGYLPGTGAEQRYIFVTAHYDHLGIRSGRIYNGADDNASGTAALLALAEYLGKHPTRHPVIFAAFSGEELGLQGSEGFVRSPPVPLSTMGVEINMDMISRSTRNEINVLGTWHYPFLRPWLEPLSGKAGAPTLVFGHDTPEPKEEDWTLRSDHAPFHKAGIPFICFGGDDHADYHRPTDDFGRINPVFFVRTVEMITRAIAVLDDRLDEFPARAGA
ncbi:M28 family peptidase [Inquilinus limosus]|uniref:M28 family peptidase n=1 Tax=Inquilinus limosus TaxID=171674 RepID=UPI00047BFE4A|nr:M28 family peptidase [Inquilinus limosus]